MITCTVHETALYGFGMTDIGQYHTDTLTDGRTHIYYNRVEEPLHLLKF